MLYTQNELTQEEIAQRVGVARATIGRWIKEEKWELLRTSLMMSREAQLSALYDSLGEMNKKRLSRPEGERVYTQQEADSIAKISKSIERMQTEVGIVETTSVLSNLLAWVRKEDIEEAKHVERSIHNVDSSGERAFKGSGWTESWDLSYRYSLFMETRDSIFFSHVDTNYVSRLFETMCHYIRQKELQRVSIYLTYVYEEDHRSVAYDKRYHLRRESSAFVFYDPYP